MSAQTSTSTPEATAGSSASGSSAVGSGASGSEAGASNGSSGRAGTSSSAADVGVGFLLLTSRTFWAGYGIVLAIMGTRLPMWSWPPKSGQIIELLFCAIVFPALAQPYVGRPVLAAMRLHQIAGVHRNTLLVGAFVTLVACEKPQPWAAGVDALLLTGYLVLTDSITVPLRVLQRIASPAFLLALVAVIAGTTALVALPASSGSYRPALVAVAAAAALGSAVATAFGSAEERRVGSQRTERRNQDRPSE
ncbi:hypothetical protein Caci_3074 [Catenulispora acidiphila DSM 44928]|uniref:Uncharacterized protein n=1 Tax=Catenulispora acidiphila (strain DSM 44928 / JCM 14897 / NBRC 102108 / NRRL B-24433 / ID139908) TaxID=479433 RepID=C7Q4L4_CATAD|nr:hypothetical protein [Catenulispora acidiphila]ACU71983.1 hypothetical protein Caci_3074 [Catenulispora acidiphila DSM 44928]